MTIQGSTILGDIKSYLRELVPAADFKVLATDVEPVLSEETGLLEGRHFTQIEVSYDKGSIQAAGMDSAQVVAVVRRVIEDSDQPSSITSIRAVERSERDKGRAKPKAQPAVGVYFSHSQYMNNVVTDPSRLDLYVHDGEAWWRNGKLVNGELPRDLTLFKPPMK